MLDDEANKLYMHDESRMSDFQRQHLYEQMLNVKAEKARLTQMQRDLQDRCNN